MCWMPRLVTNTPSTWKWYIFWQEHALTACAASSDVFAWNWRVQILSEWRVAIQFNVQEIEYCTFESDFKYIFLFSKYSYWIRILMWRSRGPVRLICGYARFAKVSHFRAPTAESRGPASDTQTNFAFLVAFVSRWGGQENQFLRIFGETIERAAFVSTLRNGLMYHPEDSV